MAAIPSAPRASSAPAFARVGLVAKPGLEHIGTAVRAIAAWLEARGVHPVLEARTAAQAGIAADGAPDREALPRFVDLVIVLGGDGTLLGIADRIAQAGLDIPILGVNYGTLGFLTEIALPDLDAALEKTLAGAFEVDRRVMLHARLLRAGATRSEHVVLNDVAVTGGSLSRIVEFRVSVGGEAVATFNADGIIVSSPTGSTAYNLSAGGPIVHPEVDALVLTPIAPHTLTNRPIVIPASSAVTVLPVLKRDGDEAYVTFDGQRGEALDNGDAVHVTRSAHALRLVRVAPRSYYAVLREKLRWTER
jgi:NAD+ kinase